MQPNTVSGQKASIIDDKKGEDQQQKEHYEDDVPETSQIDDSDGLFGDDEPEGDKPEAKSLKSEGDPKASFVKPKVSDKGKDEKEASTKDVKKDAK